MSLLTSAKDSSSTTLTRRYSAFNLTRLDIRWSTLSSSSPRISEKMWFIRVTKTNHKCNCLYKLFDIFLSISNRSQNVSANFSEKKKLVGGEEGKLCPVGVWLLQSDRQMDVMKAIVSFFPNYSVFAPREPLSPPRGVSINAHFRLVEANFGILLPVVMRYVRTPCCCFIYCWIETKPTFWFILYLNKAGTSCLNKRLATIAAPNDVHHRL